MYRFAFAALFHVLFAAQAHPAPPEPLDLDAFGYSSPQVRESLERFLDTARRTAGDGWTHRVLATSTDRRDFHDAEGIKKITEERRNRESRENEIRRKTQLEEAREKGHRRSG